MVSKSMSPHPTRTWCRWERSPFGRACNANNVTNNKIDSVMNLFMGLELCYKSNSFGGLHQKLYYICADMRQKLFLLAALLLFSFPLHAQWFVGGAVSFNNSQLNHTTNINFRPDIGYGFGKVNVGVVFLAEYYRFSEDNVTEWNLGISPYAQYYFWSSGILSLFLEGGVAFTRYITREEPYTRWVPYLTPGMEITLTDHWSVVGYLGRIGYDSFSKTVEIGVEMENFAVGVYYNF